MTALEINRVYSVLNAMIHEAIMNSVDFVVSKSHRLGTSPQEPDFIASLTLNFTKDIFNILKILFPKQKFSVTGIYCHQKPLVDIKLTKKPELGDLLLVYINTDKYGVKKLNSILFQAKITNSAATSLPVSEEHQLKLYLEWPEFTYHRAGPLNGTKRNIQPKTINDGGQYMLIDDHPVLGLAGHPATFPIGCAIPAKTLCLDRSLSTELIEFFKFKSGRLFEPDYRTSSDDWTKMIWELIEITKSIASKRKNIGINRFPRQSTEHFDGCCFIQTDTKSVLGDLHGIVQDFKSSGNEPESNNLDNNFALSLILLESSQEAE